MREVLRRTLASGPIALTMLGAPSCGPGPYRCGNQIIIAGPSVKLPDGGLDCSFCTENYVVVDCYQTTLNSNPVTACDVEQFCGGGTGRRPASLLAAGPRDASSSIGAYFAAAARLEEASVVAFRVLAGELTAHGAPAALVAWCRRSATEEITHTRLTSMLARRYRATPERAAYARVPEVRTFEEIAAENAVEGCARESFGAVIAALQARHAADPVVARAMSSIAADELRHAELGWAVAEWCAPKLSRVARDRIDEARALAIAALVDEQRPFSSEEQLLAGLPSAEVHSGLATRFRSELAPLA